MFTKGPGVVVDGPNAAGDFLDSEAIFQLAGGGIPGFGPLPNGLPVVRDITKLVNVSTNNAKPTIPINQGSPGPFPVGAPDQVLLSTAAVIGDIYGVIQGPDPNAASQYGQTPTAYNPVGSVASPIKVITRRLGVGWVLVGVRNGGTAVTVNAALNLGTTDYWGVVGSRAIGTSIGKVIAYPVDTKLTAAVSAGSNAVTVASSVGINTSCPVTVGSGVTQETVTPSAVVQGVCATQTVTIAGTAAAGTTIVVTVGGGASSVPAVSVTYLTVSADTTATIIAGKVVALLNASLATTGLAPFLQVVTNSAGVITLAAQYPGTAYNTIPTTTSATGGTVTSTAGGATLLGGTNDSFTATFAYGHSSGEPVQGLTTTGSIIAVPAAAGWARVAAVLADLNSLG
jgi:hypothetical protein